MVGLTILFLHYGPDSHCLSVRSWQLINYATYYCCQKSPHSSSPPVHTFTNYILVMISTYPFNLLRIECGLSFWNGFIFAMRQQNTTEKDNRLQEPWLSCSVTACMMLLYNMVKTWRTRKKKMVQQMTKCWSHNAVLQLWGQVFKDCLCVCLRVPVQSSHPSCS